MIDPFPRFNYILDNTVNKMVETYSIPNIDSNIEREIIK